MDFQDTDNSSLQLCSRCPWASTMAATAELGSADWLLHWLKLSQPCGTQVTPAEDLAISDLLGIVHSSKSSSLIRSQPCRAGSLTYPDGGSPLILIFSQWPHKSGIERRDSQNTSSRGIHPLQAASLKSPGMENTQKQHVHHVEVPPQGLPLQNCSDWLETRRRNSRTKKKKPLDKFCQVWSQGWERKAAGTTPREHGGSLRVLWGWQGPDVWYLANLGKLSNIITQMHRLMSAHSSSCSQPSSELCLHPSLGQTRDQEAPWDLLHVT